MHLLNSSSYLASVMDTCNLLAWVYGIVFIVAVGVHVVVVLTRTPLVNEESTPKCLLKTRW